MFNRYYNRDILKNNSEKYKELFKNRNVKFINQYSSPAFEYPTEKQMKLIQTVGYIWKNGDRFYKLAHEFYGDSTMWWIIAKFNKSPTESHIEIGDEIMIPYPLSTVLEYMKG